MKTTRKFALTLLACALVGLLAACGFNAEDHAKALLPVLQKQVQSMAKSGVTFTVNETDALDSKAEALLKKLQAKGSPAIDASETAVAVKSEAEDKNDTAGLTKEAKAIVAAIKEKESQSSSDVPDGVYTVTATFTNNTITDIPEGNDTITKSDGYTLTGTSGTGAVISAQVTKNVTLNLGLAFGEIQGTDYIVAVYEDTATGTTTSTSTGSSGMVVETFSIERLNFLLEP